MDPETVEMLNIVAEYGPLCEAMYLMMTADGKIGNEEREVLTEHRAHAALANDHLVDHAHGEPRQEDESLRRGDDEVVASGEHVEPGGLAADVIDDHHEHTEAPKEVDPQVALAGALRRGPVIPAGQAIPWSLPHGRSLARRTWRDRQFRRQAPLTS